MARQQTPNRRSRPKHDLGDSWVVESDGDDESDVAQSTASIPSVGNSSSKQSANAASSPRKRPLKSGMRASLEPELRMPVIDEGPMQRSTKSPRKEGRPSRSNNVEGVAAKNSSNGFSPPVEILDGVIKILKHVTNWVLDVMGGTFSALKTPISYMIAAYLLFVFMAFLRNIIFTPIYGALTPLCRIPGVSFLPLSMCRAPISAQYQGDETPAAEFEQLINVQNTFEDIIEHTVPGASLPLDMKRSEHAVRDLRAIVKHSKLPSASEFVFEFNGYVEAADKASWDLSTFNVHIRGAVDRIVMHSRVTRRNLDDMNVKKAAQGAIGTFVQGWFISPFTPVTFGKDDLLAEYLEHMDVVKREVGKLIAEGQSLEELLRKLDDHLEAVRDLSIRDNQKAQTSKDKILSEIWTHFGGNRSRLRMTEADLRLLLQVDRLRKQALEHVGGTMVKLQGMRAELDGLKERVVNAESTENVPLEMHIENMEMGAERLHAASLAGREEADRLWSEARRRYEDGKEHDDGRLLDSAPYRKPIAVRSPG